MDVPGCIDIRTGKRIYVVNRYGVDYTHYAYEALCKALGVRGGSEAQDRSDTEKPSADVTILDNLEGSAEESTLPSKSDSSPFPRYSPRVDKLLCWAEQRQWSLDHCRHLFLFCLGVVQQCGADIDLTNPENYPLHEINHKLKTPLSHQEVENIISSLITKARSGYQYYIRDETLAQKLHMTEAEREWFCSPGGRPIDSRPAKLDFHNVMNWIIDRTTWDLEHELFPEFIHRCHDLTIRWYEENRRDKNRNGARTRARKSREGYSPEGGRPPKYSDRDRDQCIALKAEGFSIAKISRELGMPESTVRRFSKTSQKYEL